MIGSYSASDDLIPHTVRSSLQKAHWSEQTRTVPDVDDVDVEVDADADGGASLHRHWTPISDLSDRVASERHRSCVEESALRAVVVIVVRPSRGRPPPPRKEEDSIDDHDDIDDTDDTDDAPPPPRQLLQPRTSTHAERAARGRDPRGLPAVRTLFVCVRTAPMLAFAVPLSVCGCMLVFVSGCVCVWVCAPC